MLQPIQQPNKPEMSVSTPNMDTLPTQTPGESDNTVQINDGAPNDGGAAIIQELEAHLDQIPDQDKAFLAEHMTPEFIRAIGLINGPEVAQYLNQFADPNKVLVPVPRQIAEQYLAEQQSQQGGSPAQQGQSNPPQASITPPQAMPPAPQGGQGIMAPRM